MTPKEKVVGHKISAEHLDEHFDNFVFDSVPTGQTVNSAI